MISRNIEAAVLRASKAFPVVTITGPRQSGKTTLSRHLFSGKPFVSLEALEQRSFAGDDPRGFLAQYPAGAVIDEVQRVPSLMSYLQVDVDESREMGRFILTGSANLTLLESVSQSLAGRTAICRLLPCARDEYLRFASPGPNLWRQIWLGGFPAIPDRDADPQLWFDAYATTYIERDVRQIVNVSDLNSFQTFVGLLAGRIGQLLNLSHLGNDAGVTHNTARSWISVLEAGYIGFRLPPFHANIKKRLVKSPKFYFYDTGLACFFLGIAHPDQLITHPLRGQLFENWVVAEVLKSELNQLRRPRLSFLRDHQGHEVDLIIDRGDTAVAVEIKSGATVVNDYFKNLRWLQKYGLGSVVRKIDSFVVYGGEDSQNRTSTRVESWNRLSEIDWSTVEVGDSPVSRS